MLRISTFFNIGRGCFLQEGKRRERRKKGRMARLLKRLEERPSLCACTKAVGVKDGGWLWHHHHPSTHTHDTTPGAGLQTTSRGWGALSVAGGLWFKLAQVGTFVVMMGARGTCNVSAVAKVPRCDGLWAGSVAGA